MRRRGDGRLKDPIGFLGKDSNLYQYSAGNPISNSDNFGLLTKDKDKPFQRQRLGDWRDSLLESIFGTLFPVFKHQVEAEDTLNNETYEQYKNGGGCKLNQTQRRQSMI